MIMVLLGMLLGVVLTFVVQIKLAERSAKKRKTLMGRRFEAITRGKN